MKKHGRPSYCIMSRGLETSVLRVLGPCCMNGPTVTQYCTDNISVFSRGGGSFPGATSENGTVLSELKSPHFTPRGAAKLGAWTNENPATSFRQGFGVPILTLSGLQYEGVTLCDATHQMDTFWSRFVLAELMGQADCARYLPVRFAVTYFAPPGKPPFSRFICLLLLVDTLRVRHFTRFRNYAFLTQTTSIVRCCTCARPRRVLCYCCGGQGAPGCPDASGRFHRARVCPERFQQRDAASNFHCMPRPESA